MHLSLLLLASLLFVFGAEGSYEELAKYKGFKHIPAWNLFIAVEKSHYNKKDPFKTMCQYFYCHGETNAKCNTACDEMSTKVTNDKLLGKMNNSTEAVIDVAECEKQCESYCGKNHCSKECNSLCATHFSFANRKEYEMEFYDLVGRLQN